MTMVERVARALAFSAGSKMVRGGQSVATREQGWDLGGGHFTRYVDAHWKEHVHAAGFAIAAMREPTEEMKNAKVGDFEEAVFWDYSCQVCGGLKFGWQAMIDAALSDGSSPNVPAASLK